nr:hypothetical transcript [Hymenolepis microstoma]
MPLIDLDSGIKPKRAQCKFPWEENILKNRQDVLSIAESSDSIGNNSLKQLNLMQYNVRSPTETFKETSFDPESNRHRRAVDSRKSRNHKYSDFQKSKSLSEPLRNSSPAISQTGRRPLRQMQLTSNRESICDGKFRPTSPPSWFQNKKTQTDFSSLCRKRLSFTDREGKHNVMSASNRSNTPNSELFHIKTNSGEMEGKSLFSKHCLEMPGSQSSYATWKLNKLQQELDELSFRMDKTEDQLSSALGSIEKICEFMQTASLKSQVKTGSDVLVTNQNI